MDIFSLIHFIETFENLIWLTIYLALAIIIWDADTFVGETAACADVFHVVV